MCSKPLLAQEPGCCGYYGWGALSQEREHTEQEGSGPGRGGRNAGILLRQLKGKTGDAQEKWKSNTQEGEEGLSWSREQEQRLEGATVGACL